MCRANFVSFVCAVDDAFCGIERYLSASGVMLFFRRGSESKVKTLRVICSPGFVVPRVLGVCAQ